MNKDTIAGHLRLLRGKQFTQAELAKRLGVTTASVSKYEMGEVIPDIEKLIKYCLIFNVSLDYIVGLSDNTDETVKPIEYKPDEIELLELFKQLPDKYKYEVKGYIKGIISSNN